MKPKLIIITDLDGTLLHPMTYSFKAAMPALEMIGKMGIPLVLCSSKTRAEIELYKQRLCNVHPFISENGGGVFMPLGYFPFPLDGEERNDYKVVAFGRSYDEVRKVLSEIKDELKARVRGFGDMTVKEVAAVANMAIDEASRAKEREFDEPFLFEGTKEDREKFMDLIEKKGFNYTQGRFLHILGDHDKGRAAKLLIRFYERIYGSIITVGLGDSPNDLPLLKAVDVPVLIQKDDGTYEAGIDLPGIIRSEGVGPDGWNKVIIKILEVNKYGGLLPGRGHNDLSQTWQTKS